MTKIAKRIKVRMPSLAEDKAITAAARSDPDALPLTRKQLASMVPMKSVIARKNAGDKKLVVAPAARRAAR